MRNASALLFLTLAGVVCADTVCIPFECDISIDRPVVRSNCGGHFSGSRTKLFRMKSWFQNELLS